MSILPDLVTPCLRVVFCGTAAGQMSAARGHYYAGPGNAFWQILHQAGFTDTLLTSSEDDQLPALGIGLTDLVKDVAQNHDRGLKFDLPALVRTVDEFGPEWIAFTSKKAAEEPGKFAGHRKPGLGVQPWTIGGSRVFVLPSSSGANRGGPYDGRPTRVEWWAELAELAGFHG